MRTLSRLILTLTVLLLTCEAKGNNANEANKTGAGAVTAHSRGLHGYIGYSASRPPDRSSCACSR